MDPESQRPNADERVKRRGLLARLRAWLRGAPDEIDAAEAEIERHRRELEEKNRRGTRRTDGRI